MSEYTFRLATGADYDAIVAFMRKNWDSRHPLIELPDFFDYYYRGENGRLNFALCEQDGTLAALAGLLYASRSRQPDVWVSLWAADKAAKGSGLELMAELPRLSGCRTLSCNNIRPETLPFYHFLGYHTGRMGHFYRLADKPEYAVARLATKDIPPAGGAAQLTALPDETALLASGFVPPDGSIPHKDLWYLTRRFYHYPRQQYLVYAAHLPNTTVAALLCARVVPVNGTCVLRIADYIGPVSFIPELGCAIDALMRQHSAEYADWYCAGVPAKTMRSAGFAERTENSPDIIPNYLTPPLYENTDFYYFTTQTEGFTMFKADGDQDRPHIPV